MIPTRPTRVRRSVLPRALTRRWAALLCALGMVVVPMLALDTPASATPFPEPPEFVNVAIDSVSPSTVGTDSPRTVTITGTLNNVGDRPVTDLVMRVQRGEQVSSGAQLRTSLIRDPAQYETATRFTEITRRLDPGQRRPFSLTVPLSSTPTTPGLDITRPGIYPLLVNLNGTPDYGSAARLDDSRTLLSVLGVPPDTSPPDAGDPTTGGTPASASVAPTVSAPAQLTLMWPLAAPGQLAPGITGGGDEPVRLISDDLATSLRPGGRLYGLLTTLDEATGSTDAPLTQSACLAIDPDLLITVQAMTSGYRVSRDPTDPRSSTREGTGAAAAQEWLQRLRTTASRLCVVAMPFAQADLDTLARVDDPELTRTAVQSPADLVDRILGVRSQRGVALPVSGALDDTAARLLASSDIDHALVASTAVTRTQAAVNGQYRTGSLAVQTYDPAVTTALSAMGAAPATPAITADDQRFDLDAESQVSRRVAATAAVNYAAIAPTDEAETRRVGGTPDDPTVGRSEVIMPPAVWSASADDARAILSTAAALLDSGLATARPLGTVTTDLGTATATGSLRVPVDTTLALTGLGAETTALLDQSAGLIFQLEASMVTRGDSTMTPRTYMAPLDEDLIRAMRSAPVESTADRRSVVATSVARVRAVNKTLDRIRDAVSILDPGGRYTLASERSPLLLVVRNDLPVSIRVRVDSAAPANLDIGDIGVVEIPPRGTRQIQLPTQAKSSATMTVNIALVTSSGVAMGSTIDLSVHSNAYGKALFIITICAGVALVLLAGRRLWHRFRGEPDPADLDRPEPDERERLMADSRYLHQHDSVPPRWPGSTDDG